MDDIIEIIDMIEDGMVDCFKTKGVKGVDTSEMSQVSDIYLDLVKALYYHTVIKAMENATPEEIKQMAM